MKKILQAVIICLFMTFLGTPSISAAKEAQPAQVYISDGESPRQVLSYLLGLFGRELVGSNLSSRPVSGKFKVNSVEEVMAYFERAYNISWFEHGSKIYLYKPSDWTTERVYVGDYESTTDWDEMLRKAGLGQSKFNVLYKSDDDELVVSAPKSYLQLLKNAFEAERPEEEKGPESEPTLMVFPLRHASVEDRKITLREKEFTTRGVYSILVELLDNQKNFDPERSYEDARKLIQKSVRGADAVKPEDALGIPNFGNSGEVYPDEKEEGYKAARRMQGVVSSDVRTNSILIRDHEEKREFYASLIKELDKPVSMIEVEAMLVEIDTGTLNQLGLEFGIQGSFQYQFPNTNRFAAGTNPLTGSSSIVSPDNFIARLRALESESDAKVLARPTIVTQDNVSAFIDLSETVYLQIQGERVADVVPITAGSLLQVTPRLLESDGESQIFVNIEIQDGTLMQETGQVNPTVRNTVLSTQAVINRDKAILIGGYNREVSSDIVHKVPVLGNLPFVGGAFTSKEVERKNYVRLFLITPRVVEQPTHFAKSTRDAAKIIVEEFGEKSIALEEASNLKPLKIDTQLSSGN